MVLKNINVNVTGFMAGKQIINQKTTIDMRDKKAGDVVISPSIDPNNANSNTVNVEFQPNGNADLSSLAVKFNNIDMDKVDHKEIELIPIVQKNEKMVKIDHDEDEPEVIDSDEDERRNLLARYKSHSKGKVAVEEVPTPTPAPIKSEGPQSDFSSKNSDYDKQQESPVNAPDSPINVPTGPVEISTV